MLKLATLQRHPALSITVLVITVLVLALGYDSIIRESKISAPSAELYDMFLEEEMVAHEFCEECYPEYQEAYPDVSCATWSNHGLSWLRVHVSDRGDVWAAAVWPPLWRFCGFPEPFPPKPEGMGVVPEEWLQWYEEQGKQRERTGIWEQPREQG